MFHSFRIIKAIAANIALVIVCNLSSGCGDSADDISRLRGADVRRKMAQFIFNNKDSIDRVRVLIGSGLVSDNTVSSVYYNPHLDIESMIRLVSTNDLRNVVDGRGRPFSVMVDWGRINIESSNESIADAVWVK